MNRLKVEILGKQTMATCMNECSYVNTTRKMQSVARNSSCKFCTPFKFGYNPTFTFDLGNDCFICLHQDLHGTGKSKFLQCNALPPLSPDVSCSRTFRIKKAALTTYSSQNAKYIVLHKIARCELLNTRNYGALRAPPLLAPALRGHCRFHMYSGPCAKKKFGLG